MTSIRFVQSLPHLALSPDTGGVLEPDLPLTGELVMHPDFILREGRGARYQTIAEFGA